MKMLIMPVVNGVLPQPQGGRITGMFLKEQGGDLLEETGVGQELLLTPWVEASGSIYPVGVMVRVMDIWNEVAVDETGNQMPVLLANLEGRGHGRIHSLMAIGGRMIGGDVSQLNLKGMRSDYPVISGAGWIPQGGYTQFRDKMDLPVTIYGYELESGREVSVTGNLGGLVGMEQAHTLEHSIIRALHIYGLCTARTLQEAMRQETRELKESLDYGLRHALPEILGQTRTGACGNMMTNLAQFYLSEEMVENIRAGRSFGDSLTRARKATMSQLMDDLGLSMENGVRVLQGLKKGMSHDDTPIKMETMKRVIGRFPFDPWS